MQVTLLVSSPTCSHNWWSSIQPPPSILYPLQGLDVAGAVCEVWALSLALVKMLCSLTLGQAEMEPILEDPTLEEPCEIVECNHTDAVCGHKEPNPKSTQKKTDQNLGSTWMARKAGAGQLKTYSH